MASNFPFYDGVQFPAEYLGDAFVAFHATGPYNAPDGYKVVRVRFANGMPVGGYEDFVTGFMLADTTPPKMWGTPAGLGRQPLDRRRIVGLARRVYRGVPGNEP